MKRWRRDAFTHSARGQGKGVAKILELVVSGEVVAKVHNHTSIVVVLVRLTISKWIRLDVCTRLNTREFYWSEVQRGPTFRKYKS